MNPSLVQQLYAATSMWYWPVLWWQIICMGLRLDGLARQAGDDIQYCVRLGPYGTLTLRFVSDNVSAREAANTWQPAYKTILDTLCATLSPPYRSSQRMLGPSRHIGWIPASAGIPGEIEQTGLYLDPG
jgi:hypothetical protein